MVILEIQNDPKHVLLPLPEIPNDRRHPLSAIPRIENHPKHVLLPIPEIRNHRKHTQTPVLNASNNSHNAFYHFALTSLPITGASRRIYDSLGGGWGEWESFPSTPSAAFRLEGTAVPEPGVWSLLALGGACAWWATRRRRG